MAGSADEHRWTVVFDAGRFSHFFDGVETGESEAIVAAIQKARLVRAARGAAYAPYLSIEVGTGPGNMHGLTMPVTDLDLDDQTLADQVRAGVVEGLAHAHALHDAMEAVERRGPTTSPAVASSVTEQIVRLRSVIGTPHRPRGSERLDASRVDSARLVDSHIWPDELVELFTADKPVGRLTPYGALYEIDEMLMTRAHLIKARDEVQI